MNDKKLYVLTESELQNICSRFFDRGYYSALYQEDVDDKSTDVWFKCKDSLLSEINQSEVIPVVSYKL
jgi:hypothetical protein